MRPATIYEDQNLVAIDKPPGLTVVDIAALYPEWLPAHRLDRDTSGVMLLAKTPSALELLQNAFRARTVHKVYWAIMLGVPKADEGVIDLPIGRSRRDPRRRLAGRGASGTLRPALTRWRVLERYPAAGYSLLELRPETGRTHQLRVHLKAKGYPIACDALYGTGNQCPAPLARQALHAASIELVGPTGERLKLEATPSPDFAAALASLRAA